VYNLAQDPQEHAPATHDIKGHIELIREFFRLPDF
jgi:hypothetical protein